MALEKKKFIIANWKMNPRTKEAAEKLWRESAIEAPGLEVVICPPFAYLGLSMTDQGTVAKGAQNVHWRESGAFTGEVSISMLKSLDVKYVILGHSEQKDQDWVVRKKIKTVLKAKLRPIICFREKQELENRLQGLKRIKGAMIAYEPASAIGSDHALHPEKALSMAILARLILTKRYSRPVAETIPVLYGGSVSPKNAASYELDGLLVGTSSLNSATLKKIIANVSKRHQPKS